MNIANGTDRVIELLLMGAHLRKQDLINMTGEDSGRVLHEIRNRRYIPVECGRTEEGALWYMTSADIYFFFTDRQAQVDIEKYKKNKRKLERLAKAHSKALAGKDKWYYLDCLSGYTSI